MSWSPWRRRYRESLKRVECLQQHICELEATISRLNHYRALDLQAEQEQLKKIVEQEAGLKVKDRVIRDLKNRVEHMEDYARRALGHSQYSAMDLRTALDPELTIGGKTGDEPE